MLQNDLLFDGKVGVDHPCFYWQKQEFPETLLKMPMDFMGMNGKFPRRGYCVFPKNRV